MTATQQEITALERQLCEIKSRLAELRRAAGAQPFPDHELLTWDGRRARLSELFAGRDDLIVVHNMGRRCAYCTLWADGFNGILDHLESRAAFVVVSEDPVETQRELAAGRGWRFRMASAAGTSFSRDAGFVDEDGLMPGVSTFCKGPAGELLRAGRAEFGPGDDFCSAWHLFDLLAGGVAGWEPRFRYERG